MAELNDVVADVAEEVAEGAEYVAEVSRGLDTRLVVAGVVFGFATGFVAGGWYVNRRLRTQYEQIAEDEIDEMREHFRRRLVAKEEKPDLASEAGKIVQREGYDGPAHPVLQEDEDGDTPPEEEEIYEDPVLAEEAEAEAEEVTETVENVFDKDEPQEGGWDYEAEVARRRPEFPYVIHLDERHEKAGYTHTELTYYAGDDVLTDTDDKPVEEIDKVVGAANLEKFGHGSGDKDVVFIRNDALELEVEVTRDEGSYSEVVHGIKHSADPPRRRRVRFDDEDSP